MPAKVRKRGENSFQLNVACGYDPKGKQIVKSTTVTAANITEAKRLYNRFATQVLEGNDASCGRMTLPQFYDYYKENYANLNNEARTLAYNDYLFERIKEYFAKKRLDKIEVKDILAFYRYLADQPSKKDPNKKLSNSTIKKYHVLLKTMFNKAVEWNFLSYNPVDKAKTGVPKVEKTIKAIYTKEDFTAFLKALEGETTKHRLMVLLAFTGGLRREEIFGLEWQDINFKDSTIHIRQATVYIPKMGTITKGTKNESSDRVISLPRHVMVLLRLNRIMQHHQKNLLENKWTDSGRVFTTWNGEPAHPHSFNTWLRRFVINKGLTPISPHTFRHMAATYLITAGTDIRTVSGKLGHAQTSTTMNIYSHSLKTAEQQTADTMTNLLQSMTKKPTGKKKKQAN